MKEIKLEKVTLNIGTGEPGAKLDNAVLLLKNLSNRKPTQTLAKKRIPTWKIRPGLPIGCKVTLRKAEAEVMLKRLFEARNKILDNSNFTEGGFSFGIKEHIEIPKAEYDAKIGMIGLDVAVTLRRDGYRIKYRKIKKKRIPKKHLISKEEAIDFAKNKFGVEIR